MFCAHCNAAFETPEDLTAHKELVHFSTTEFVLAEKSHRTSEDISEENDMNWNSGQFVFSYRPGAAPTVASAFSTHVKEDLAVLIERITTATG